MLYIGMVSRTTAKHAYGSELLHWPPYKDANFSPSLSHYLIITPVLHNCIDAHVIFIQIEKCWNEVKSCLLSLCLFFFLSLSRYADSNDKWLIFRIPRSMRWCYYAEYFIIILSHIDKYGMQKGQPRNEERNSPKHKWTERVKPKTGSYIIWRVSMWLVLRWILIFHH